MAEYIEREALLSELQEEIDFETSMYTEEQNKYFNMGLKCAVRDVKSQPTADVVPKSEYDAAVSAVDYCTQEFLRLHDDYQEAKREVEMLQGALKAEEQHNELTMEMAKKALANAKAEVAREIFEEIKICMKNFEDDDDGYLLKKCEFEFFMRELKKKYTEEPE